MRPMGPPLRLARGTLRRLAGALLVSLWLAPADAALLSVPSQIATLQQAIDQAGAGDVIELANGTYPAPPGDAATQGFHITDKAVDFTIRAAASATVVLDGQGSGAILRFQNTDVSKSGHVTFEGLVFRNGLSNVQGLTAGVTLQKANGTFLNCVFDSNNTVEASTVGGGVQVAVGSTADFEGSTWSNNSSPFSGGGLSVADHSSVVVRDSQFLDNRCNLPGHSPTASGGAIHAGNSTLFVERTRFDGNQAGYSGGGIYAIGDFDDAAGGSTVTVHDCTFSNNLAIRDPSVSFSLPTEGGGVHAENLTAIRVYDSRFLGNQAHDGGGLNAYRAQIEIYDSVFRGNQATGGAASGTKSLGGQIELISNDVTADAVNRRPASLVLEDTLLEGRYGGTTIAGDVGGCLFAGGDTNRAYGLNMVPQIGDLASNRATVAMQRVVLHDCDVQQDDALPGSGVGGGIAGDLVDLTLQDSLVLDSDAFGVPGSDSSSGGGLALLTGSHAVLQRVTFAADTAGAYGGAVFAQGADLEVSQSAFLDNELSPGVAEACFPSSTGAALFIAPFDASGGRPAADATGFVDDSIFSGNIGLPIFDDDRTNGPINDVRYDGNEFYSSSFGGAVYTSVIPNNVPPYSVCITAAQMSALVVQRTNGTSTQKSSVANTDLGSAPSFAALTAAPSHVLDELAAGDGPSPRTSFLGYAWSGVTAMLDGSALGSSNGLTEVGQGTHTLVVDSNAAISHAVIPEPEAWQLQLGALIALAAMQAAASRMRRRDPALS